MGDVFLAEHEKLEKKVAIKSLHKNLATDLRFRERFAQEAKTHSKLDHPNIVKLLDYKERKDGLFLIMEYVDGKQLDEHIKKVTGPIPEKALTTLFTQILDAIGYAHEEGLVHRDIKPSNIMIDKKGKIKVLDFGIAKMQEEENGLTKTGIQIGTATYMSPEQVNAKKVNKLTDIYSLGVTLFYMAVGKSPYDGETNTFSIQTSIVSDPLPSASDIYPGVSKKLEAIILKATQKDKKDRYQSCEEFKKNIKSKNVVLPKVSEASTQKQEVKKVNKFVENYSVSVVVLLFVIGGFLVLYNNYQNTLETHKKEIEDLRLAKEEAEQERLAKEEAEQEKLAKEKAERERNIYNNNKILGCWTCYYSWACEDKLKGNNPICYSNNGTWGDFLGDNEGTWELVNNSYTHVYPPTGVTYKGTYSNGLIIGSMFNPNNGKEGCFRLVKQ